VLATRPQKIYSYNFRTTTYWGCWGRSCGGITSSHVEGMNGDRRHVPMNSIRWIGMKSSCARGEIYTRQRSAGDPCDRDGEWDVFTLCAGTINPMAHPWDSVHSGRRFARELAALCQTKLHEYGGSHEDLGPTHARQMNQVCLGQWHAADGDDSTLDVSVCGPVLRIYPPHASHSISRRID